MKKIIGLIVVGILLIAGFIAGIFLIGTSGEQEFEKQTYEVLAKDIMEVNIDVRDRFIKVESSNDDNIYIDYEKSEKEDYDIKVSDGVLSMSSKTNKKWTDFIGNKVGRESRKIVIRIPNDLIKSLKISTTNENVQIGKLSIVDNIETSINGGNISLDNIFVGKSIKLSSKNGNIEGSIVGGYDDFSIKCKVKKGECNLPKDKDDGLKQLIINANNGDVNIDLNK